MRMLEVDPNGNGLIVASQDGYVGTMWKKASRWIDEAKDSTSTLVPLIDDVPIKAVALKDKLVTSVDNVGNSLPDITSPIVNFVSSIFN